MYPYLLRAYYTDSPLPVACTSEDHAERMATRCLEDGASSVEICKRRGDTDVFDVIETRTA